jgi:hypothetical protein
VCAGAGSHCHQRGDSVRVAEVRVVFDQGQISLLARDDVNVLAAMEYLSGKVLQEMTARAPVSPVHPVYATKGRTVAGGRRLAGDFPLRPSGYLRSSCRRLREPDGGYIIGPTPDYALYVNNGTGPHVITSHGPWPLRNRATGQVFGRVVHHPGTRPQPFIVESLQAIARAVVRG